MFRLVSAVFLLVVIQHGVEANRMTSQEVLEECRATYSAELDHDYLIGEWFEVMKFTFFGAVVPSSSCVNQVFSKATAENLTIYEEAYGITVSMDDEPLILNRANCLDINLVTGKSQAKDMYAVPPAVFETIKNYKRLTDDYALVWDCALRGNTIWLLSRIQHPTNEEIAKVIEGVTEVRYLESQRFCSV